MTLNLYLDDCMNSHRLAELLQQAGHRIVRPTDEGVGTDRADDDVHFRYAVENGLTILTKNYGDFEALHDSNDMHFGIIAVRYDNDKSRDMGYAEIVKALSNLCNAAENSGPVIHGNYHNLNDWRY